MSRANRIVFYLDTFSLADCENTTSPSAKFLSIQSAHVITQCSESTPLNCVISKARYSQCVAVFVVAQRACCITNAPGVPLLALLNRDLWMICFVAYLSCVCIICVKIRLPDTDIYKCTCRKHFTPWRKIFQQP